MAATKRLTELESCALALIRRFQPCSTYLLRSEFARSTTTEWSASAGSIYPVIKRLVQLELVEMEKRPGAARGRRDLRITKEGERAVRDWILHMESANASATPDPIRTRAYFLEQLGSGADRRAFLGRAEALTRERIQQLRALAKTLRVSSDADELATLGALFQLEARLKWLLLIRRTRPLLSR